MCDWWWVPAFGGVATSILVGLWQTKRDIRRLQRQGKEYAKLRAIAEHIAEHRGLYGRWPIYQEAAEVAATPREWTR